MANSCLPNSQNSMSFSVFNSLMHNGEILSNSLHDLLLNSVVGNRTMCLSLTELMLGGFDGIDIYQINFCLNFWVLRSLFVCFLLGADSRDMCNIWNTQRCLEEPLQLSFSICRAECEACRHKGGSGKAHSFQNLLRSVLHAFITYSWLTNE